MNSWELTAEEQQALFDFVRALVRTPSFPGDEGAVATLIMAEMRRLGFDDVWMDDAGNVVGRVGPQEGPALMFNSHMDTVEVADPAAWRVDPFGVEVQEGRLYGLGACDMKSGLAATVHAAALLRSTGRPGARGVRRSGRTGRRHVHAGFV
jgi:acetylornithine deacetylase/succinyl-diaminopimelate desuccinylase-like protein